MENQSSHDVSTHLSSAELLRDLEERDVFADYFTLVELSERETLIAQDDTGNDLYILVSGAVRIEAERAGFKDTVARFFGSGVFGEIAFVAGSGKRTASVIAETRCAFLKISREDFDRVASDHPRAAAGFLMELSSRIGHKLMDTTQKMIELGERVNMIAKGAGEGALESFRQEFQAVIGEFIGLGAVSDAERLSALPPEIREKALSYGESLAGGEGEGA